MSDQCPICELPTVNGVCPLPGLSGKALLSLMSEVPDAWLQRSGGALIDAWGCHVRAEERERCALFIEEFAGSGRAADGIRALGPTAHHEGDKVQRLIEAAVKRTLEAAARVPSNYSAMDLNGSLQVRDALALKVKAIRAIDPDAIVKVIEQGAQTPERGEM